MIPTKQLKIYVWILMKVFRFKHHPMREALTHPFFGDITVYELVSSRHWT